jgi:sugar phosphate permease
MLETLFLFYAQKQSFKIATLVVLILCYTASYTVVTTLSVATPLLTSEYGFSNGDIGMILTISTLLRILPKFFSGIVTDYLGGKRVLITSLLGMSVLCMGFPLFPSIIWMGLLWSTIRILQTTSWPAVVKISSRWFAQSEMGKALSLTNMAFFCALFLLQILVTVSFSTKSIFIGSGIICLVITLGGAAFLRESPTQIGLEEPRTDPNNALGDAGEGTQLSSWRDVVYPIYGNPKFWLIAMYYAMMNLIRQLLLDWMPLYLTQTTNCSSEYAVLVFLLFTLVGSLSGFLFGVINDRVVTLKRDLLSVVFGVCCTVSLFVTVLLVLFDPFTGSSNFYYSLACYTVLNTLIGFFLCGPYSLAGSVLCVSFGGKKICATVSSSLDGIATLLSLLSGCFGAVSDWPNGWAYVFGIMTITSFLSVIFLITHIVIDKVLLYCKQQPNLPVSEIVDIELPTLS